MNNQMLGTLTEFETNIHIPEEHVGYASHELAELLDVLYSTVLHPDHWHTFLNRLCKVVQCRHGVMTSEKRDLGLTVRTDGESDFCEMLEGASHRRYATGDPFRPRILQNRLIGIYNDDDLLPNEGLLRTEYYREHLKPRGLRYATVIVATVDPAQLELFSLWRTFDQGPSGQGNYDLLEFLFPHIQRALHLRHRIDAGERRAACAEAMIDANVTATFLIRKDGQLVHRNSAGTALLASGDSLCLLDGSITAVSARSKMALRSLLEKAGKVETEPHAVLHHAISLERAFGKSSVKVIATSLTPAARKRTGADIVMLASDPVEPTAYADHVLHSLYGLSKAETEVANGLLAGYSLDKIGKLRNVSTGTVRQQLKAIMARTGTQRQGELISLLLRIPQQSKN